MHLNPQKGSKFKGELDSTKIILIFFFILFTLFIENAFGQLNEYVKVVPPSPNVGSMLKVSDVNVNLYTGIINNSIPVYNVKTKNIDVPISLDYANGGIRVAETASWAGLGWGLIVGGVINQSVKGLEDDILAPERIIDRTDIYKVYDVLEQNKDSEPDEFSFSFLGKSGKFYLDSLGKPLIIPYQSLKIAYKGVGAGKFWEVTDETGIIYEFKAKEVVYGYMMNHNNTMSGTYETDNSSNGQNNNISWLLTKIITPGGENIVFEYDDISYVNAIFLSESKLFLYRIQVANYNDVPVYYKNAMKQVTNGKRIKRITFPNGKVEFIAGGNRCDLPGDNYLKEIVVYNNSVPIKHVKLKHNYLVGANLVDTESIDCSNELGQGGYNLFDDMPAFNKRLLLSAIDEVNPVTLVSNGKYLFDYEHTYGMPGKMSCQQDLWGYYNGNGQNSLLTNVRRVGAFDYIIENREPSLLYAKQGMLKKITYPTGGSNEFEYELNEVKSPDTPPSYVIPEQQYTINSNSNDQLIGKITVNDHQGGAYITFNISCFAPFWAAWPNGFRVIGNGHTYSSNVDLGAAASSGTANFYLQNGIYEIRSYSVGTPPNCETYTLTIPSRTEIQYLEATRQVGGLRIKRINIQDDISSENSIRSFEYLTSNNGQSESSGALAYPDGDLKYSFSKGVEVREPSGGYFDNRYMNVSSHTNYPMTYTKGGVVGYHTVTEKSLNNSGESNGETVYKFTTYNDTYFRFRDYPQLKNTSYPLFFCNCPSIVEYHDGDLGFPYPPAYSYDWMRGLLKEKATYSLSNNTKQLINKKVNNYSLPIILGEMNAYKAGYLLKSSQDLTIPTTSHPQGLIWSNIITAPYTIWSAYSQLLSTDEMSYDKNGNAVTVTNNYTYDNPKHLMATRIDKNTSNNVSYQQHYLRPHEMVTSGRDPSGIYQEMITKNMIHPIIEESTITNGKTTLSRTNYIQPHVGVIVPGSVDVLNNSTGLDETRFVYSNYNSKGNLLSARQEKGLNICYVWSYNGQYPVAEIKNADYTTVLAALGGETAVTNFSDSFPADKAAVEAFLAPIRSSSTTFKDAQITTYSYEPLIGMTSSTDPKGTTTYYEYDSFQRLKCIKDQNGQVVKSYDYHYKQ